MKIVDEYERFVPHPRYGRRPQITGLNPETDYSGGVFLHWHSPRECRIPNTAIAADRSRQGRATVPVTHYYDVRRQCRDCGRPFIFFAAEQKHWYEELGFALEADCVSCVECRKRQQGLERMRQRYEELFHVTERTVEQDLEFVECGLSLIESAAFRGKALPRLRTILNRLASLPDEKAQTGSKPLRARMHALETEGSDRQSVEPGQDRNGARFK